MTAHSHWLCVSSSSGSCDTVMFSTVMGGDPSMVWVALGWHEGRGQPGFKEVDSWNGNRCF